MSDGHPREPLPGAASGGVDPETLRPAVPSDAATAVWDAAAAPSDEALTRLRSESAVTGIRRPDGLASGPQLGPRYRTGELLGVGGMGEVRSCTDVRIGREVALKSIRREAAHHGEMRARFEREARVQGQLEHPSIVPVYDLDLRPDGAYFTMRRVRGETLEQVIARLRDGDPAYVERYSRHRLLSAFAQLAQAIAFAHARGVIHRDLKPSNVMLGDYGEVYALDWGLARTGALPEPDVTHVGAELLPLGTAVGAVIGTPGYMSPEQAAGASEALDPRTDVYALGAILFEILTLEPLHRQPAQVALASTVAGGDARPSARAPEREPPPEFDAVCARACALDPEARHASARELHAEVERFLEGDRDLALRRELSARHVEEGRAAVGRAIERDDVGARTEAMRALNRALALDPRNQDAVGLLGELLLRPPRELPPEARAEMAEDVASERREMARIGAVSYASWVALAPLLVFAGVRDWVSYLLSCSIVAGSALVCLRMHRRGRISDASAFSLLAATTAAIAIFSRYLGPFMVAPALIATNTYGYAAFAPGRLRRLAAAGIGVAGVVVPIALELTGVIAPSFEFRSGELVILPVMTDLPAAHTLVALTVAGVALVMVPSYVMGRMYDDRYEVKQRLVTYLWHLRQLLPPEARRPERRR